MPYEELHAIDFKGIRLKVASPDDIHRWSYGEVTKPETINYRTQKPEKSGLFAEEIFGPSKDWECFCGKYKRIRYKGIICDKCGVEVTRSVVRRERMGHIDLSAPVSHIWFLRGVPSKIGLMLDLGVQDLEKVIYFANFVITKVNEPLREETLQQLEAEASAKRKQIEADFHQKSNQLKQQLSQADDKKKTDIEEEIAKLSTGKHEQLTRLEEAVETAEKELKTLAPLQILTEQAYQDMSLKYGHVFEASIGAEAVHHLLKEIDLDALIADLETEAADANENKQRRIVRRLRLAKNLKANGIRPEWMIMTAIPVIPPDLRPMVQLDGGRFATSDLNDLYRRVINRNNRLKRLIELNAPEVITRNEKRMLQEAVDALIDNGARHGKTVTASTGQKRMLRSIADMLKGKQGRFRQNLLGKRVDYSGRSVIVIGPHLRLNQCGLPKRMALELFRPFVISQLIKRELVHNVRSAGRYIEAGHPEVWDILEEVTVGATVLLNRAPTLHRLGIQAFQPILIEGKAIQVHPLVCSAFNADFDGDQMAVHVPLTEQAKWEAANLMMSTRNLLKPATGTPVVTPNMDIVLGCYYMTQVGAKKDLTFAHPDEAVIAYESGRLGLQDLVIIRMEDGERKETTVGRVLFNRILPKAFGYINDSMDKKTLSGLVSRSFAELGADATVDLLDAVKNFGFSYVTQSGISWGMSDLEVPVKKAEVIAEAEKKIHEIQEAFEAGLLTDQERYIRVINTWSSAKEEIQAASKETLDKLGPVYMMINSGARGSWAQTTQMMGMKGLVANPSGKTMELPVKASFKEGLDVLEYFISTHGTRKGLTDTALKTANAGYLTRRLVDVAQDIVVNIDDCGDETGFTLTRQESEDMGYDLWQRITGRVLAQDLHDVKGKVLLKAGELVTPMLVAKLKKSDVDQASIRSVLTCQAKRGICRQCYGFDLSRNELVKPGTAVGIIAAQSIGEPGTQLTMRTFHTGGVAGGEDITQGLPRVEELFEARPVKSPAVLAEVDGQIVIENAGDHRVVKIKHQATGHDRYDLPKGRGKKKAEVKVAEGDKVKAGDTLIIKGEDAITAERAGVARVTPTAILVEFDAETTRDYDVPNNIAISVRDGDLVTAGTVLTEGSVNLQELYALQGRTAVQKYIIKEIQFIYSSQGQYLNDKHVEVIVRQMFSRAYVKTSGESDLVAGEVIDRSLAEEVSNEVVAKKKTPPEFESLLLGVTKASLTTESWLSAASFQETARVLIDAAVSGKMDNLRGLKENVIIGKPIPAGTGFENRQMDPMVGQEAVAAEE